MTYIICKNIIRSSGSRDVIYAKDKTFGVLKKSFVCRTRNLQIKQTLKIKDKATYTSLLIASVFSGLVRKYLVINIHFFKLQFSGFSLSVILKHGEQNLYIFVLITYISKVNHERVKAYT